MVARQLLLLLPLLIIIPFTQAAESGAYIDLSVEADEVYLGDTVLIVIESVGLLDPIDTSVLSHNARFERETVGTRIMVQSGKVVEVKLRRMEFTPTRTGPIVFGPVSSEDVSSNSVSIVVVDAVRSEWVPAPDDLLISVKASSLSPWLHSQVTLDIVLRHHYSIAEEQISLPDLDGFLVRPVYEKRRTFTNDSQQWRQISWRYLLFPERSGELVIDPVHWTGTTIKSRPERASFERTSTPVRFSVKAAKTEDSQWWLPANGLRLSESWSSEITAIKAGDELTRTIHIEVDNALSSQIPTPVIHQSRALTQTMISSNREETVHTNGMLAKADFVYRIKAQSPIPVFMDTVRLSWWNTQSNVFDEAIIPARRINVGLPEREDLLKQVALAETGTSGMRQWWLSADTLRVSIYLLAAAAVVSVLLIALLSLVPAFRSKIEKARLRRHLLRLAQQQNWPQLISALLPLYSAHYRNQDNPLLADLQQALYGAGYSELNELDISEQISVLNLVSTQPRFDREALVTL